MPTANSVIIAFFATGLTMLITITATFRLVRYRFGGRSLLTALMMTPMMVPHIIMALAYYRFFAPLHLLGTHAGVVVAHTCFNVPFAFLIISAALKGFDRNLERAAMSAGASPVRTFLYVMLPVLRPAFLIAAVFSFVHSFDEATVAIFISGRVAQTLPRKMLSSIRMDADPVIAVVSTLRFALVLLAILVSVFWRGLPQWAPQAGVGRGAR